MKPKKVYRGETTPDEDKQLNLTRAALDVTLFGFDSAFVLGIHDGSLATSSNIDKAELSEILISLANEFAHSAMFEDANIQFHERHSQERSASEKFDDLIDVLVALKNGKMNQREGLTSLTMEMGFTNDVAEKLISTILQGNLFSDPETNNEH